jgi:two-component system nitrogen regulation response regulator GlnG
LPLAERIQHASDALEAEILRTTLRQLAGNKAAAARVLQIDYTTLHRKLKRHGIDG